MKEQSGILHFHSLFPWERVRERAYDPSISLTFGCQRLCDLQSRWQTRIKRYLGLTNPHPQPLSQREKGELHWKLYAQLTVVLLTCATLKYFYSTASVNQLRWILAPVTLAVEFISGRQFAFEPYAGYIDSRHTFVIAASCAGVNFLITAFLMLALGKLWRERSQKTKWRFLPIAAAVAYVTTVIANTVRITTAMQLRRVTVGGSLTAGELHRLEGVFVYFGFLLLLYVLSERVSERTLNKLRRSDANNLSNRGGWLLVIQRSFFPLLIYYVTTLGIPVLNGAFRQTDFWEHSLFVLLIPLVFVIPFAGLIFMRRIWPDHLTFATGVREPTLVGHSLALNERPTKVGTLAPSNSDTADLSCRAIEPS